MIKKTVIFQFFKKHLKKFFLIQKKATTTREIFCISQCMKHPKVFGCMFQLKSKKNYAKTVIEGLKVLNEAQKKVQLENIVNQL